ncbi:hypothetical protein D3C72_1037170 [compost metagenome]
MAGVGHHRQVAEALDQRDGGHVEGVAGGVVVGADAALAEDHLAVARGEQVLGGEQPLLDGGGGAALEHDRLARATRALEQGEVLHVARADLDDVGVALDELEALVVDRLGDDSQPEGLAGLGQDLEPFLAHALEGVGAGARLERAAPQHRRARGGHALGGGEELLAALDAAGAGHHGDGAAADLGAVGQGDDRVFALPLAADLLVGRGHGDRLGDAGQIGEEARLEGTLVAEHADRHAVAAGDLARREAEAGNAGLDGLNLRRGGLGVHHDQHRWLLGKGEADEPRGGIRPS